MSKEYNRSDSDGDGPKQPPYAPQFITANPRKFSEYVLDPSNAEGKDRIFIGRFGFRSQSEEDAQYLSATYAEQARARLAVGDYGLVKLDVHGQRYAVPIELRGRRIRSIWILRSDGVLSLVTPFSGFLDRRR